MPVYQSPLYALAATTQHDWQFWKHMQLRRMPARLTRQTYIDTWTWSKNMNMICMPTYRFPFLRVNVSDHRLVNLLAFGRIQSSISALQHAQQLNSIYPSYLIDKDRERQPNPCKPR